MSFIKQLESEKKTLIGMIHLAGNDADMRLTQAIEEIDLLYNNGFDAVLVENYHGDVSDMRNALEYLRTKYPRKNYGLNVLGDYEAGFELARTYNAGFLQIDSVAGHLPPEQDLEYEHELNKLRIQTPNPILLGGVHFKYQPHLSGRGLNEDLVIGGERAETIVVSGPATGEPCDVERLKVFRDGIGLVPLILGSGLTPSNFEEQMEYCDGAIVGTSIKEGDNTQNPIELNRVKEIVRVRDSFGKK